MHDSRIGFLLTMALAIAEADLTARNMMSLFESGEGIVEELMDWLLDPGLKREGHYMFVSRAYESLWCP